MKRLALWIVCICAGVLVHLALAFAYWAELDGESRYDMGGAFMGNMQVSIMPDMGQGTAGGNQDVMANGDGEEVDSEPMSAQVPAQEPAQMPALEPSETVADAMVDPASTQTQANETELKEPSEPEVVASDATEPEPSVEPNIPETIDAAETATPDDEPVFADKSEVDASPATEPVAEPQTGPVVATKEPEPQSPEPVVPSITGSETKLQAETEPEPDEPEEPQPEEGAVLRAPVSKPAPEPLLASKPAIKPEMEAAPAPQPEVEMAVEDERVDPVQPMMLPKFAPVAEAKPEEDPSEEEAEPAQQVSLMQGGALTALPASAPRPKIKPAPAPKGLRVAKAEGLKDGGSSQTARSSSSRKAAGAARNSGHSPKASVRGDGGTSNKAGGAGSRGVRASYATQLRRWIERHKRYPRSAKMRGVQGQGVVRIVINQSGRVLKSTLVKSAGDRYLDDEIRSLPMRASPAPKPPKEFSGARHTLTLPVRFSR